VLPDVVELAREGVGGGPHGGPQHGDQVLVVRPEMGEAGEAALDGAYRGRVVLAPGQAALEDPVVGRARAEGPRAVVEEEAVGVEGRVLVLEPEEEELLQGELPVFDSPSRGLEPVLLLHLAPVDLEGREIPGEGREEALRLDLPDLGLGGVEGLPEGPGRGLLPVEMGHVVEDLVDEGHGVEPARRTAGRGEGRVDALVDAPGEAPRRREVGDDDVAARGVEGVLEPEFRPGRPAQVEFHAPVPGPGLEPALALECLEPNDDHLLPISHPAPPLKLKTPGGRLSGASRSFRY